MKITFRLPLQRDIIIFDRECSNEIVENLFKDNYKYFILDNHPRLIYLNPLFIIQFIYLLIKRLNFREKIKRQVFHIYILNIVRYIKPKLIITFIDNNSIYSWLTQNHNECEFIAIQNGLRQRCDSAELSTLNHQHFYCFGDYDIKKHSEFGCTIDKGYPVGSFRAGLVLSNHEFVKKKYDICIISSDGRQNPNAIKKTNDRIAAINNRKIDKIIKKYISDNNLQLVVALSTDNNYEKNYYKSVFGENVDMKERRDSLSTYETIRMSNVSVSFMSTMILETIALGNKGVSIHFEDTNLYFDYPETVRYLYKDYALFSKYMNELLQMTDSEYTKEIKNTRKDVMNNDSNNPPHKIIKKHIENIIENIR